MLLRLLCSIAILGSLLPAQASSAAESAIAPRTDWTAKWIDHPTAPLREPMVFHFRKIIPLSAQPAHYVVDVSADNRFVLYVNGQRVAGGPARGDLQHWRYERIDLAPYLRSGNNIVAATVWNFGIYAPMAQISDRTAFLVQGDTPAEAAIDTNASWSVEVEYGQRCLPRPMNSYKAYFVAGPGEEIDASKYDWLWMTAKNGPNSHWVAAGPAVRESVLFDGSHPWSHNHQNDTPWLLQPDQLPRMLYTPETSGTVVRGELPGAENFPAKPITIPANTSVSLLIAKDAVTTAYPRLTVSGGKGSSIEITYAEALYDANLRKGIRTEIDHLTALGLIDRFYPDGGNNRSFEPLWWRGYRFLNLKIHTGDQPLTLNSLQTFFTAYPFTRHAYFHSNDEDLNRVWQVAWYTGTLNAHETYADSAGVEQLQYIADIRPQLLVSYAVTGDDRLARQAIAALDDSRIPEGLTQARWPSNIFQVNENSSLLWIGMVHDYWIWRPDRAFVAARLLGTRTVLNWFNHHQAANGMLDADLPFGNWVDWISKDKGFPPPGLHGQFALTTLLYVRALRQAAEMEQAVGSKWLAAEYRRRAQRASQATYRLCWDAKTGLLADTPDKTSFSQEVNAAAILTDTIPKAAQQQVVRRMLPGQFPADAQPPVPITRTSFYWQFYVARAMDHAGMGNNFLPMLQPWKEMLHRGFTTFPETPGVTREEAQGWDCHPAFDLLTIVAGIHPQGAGFAHVRIAPELGNLTSLDAAMASPSGLISVRYKISGGHLQARFTLPENLTGAFLWKGRKYPLHSGAQAFTVDATPKATAPNPMDRPHPAPKG